MELNIMTEQSVELVSTHYDGINIMTEQSVLW